MKSTRALFRLTHLVILVLSWHGLALAALPANETANLKVAITSYATNLDLLCTKIEASPTNPVPVQTYLDTCRDSAYAILGPFNRGNLGTRDMVGLLEGFNRQRIAATRLVLKQLLDANLPPLSTYPETGLENKLFATNMWPVLKKENTQNLLIQDELFHRKYLDPEDGQANFIEALAQDCPLTRFNPARTNWWRTAGVSAWEVKLRLEPVIMFNSNKDPAVLLAGGLIFNFFPAIKDGGLEDRILSRNVKRTGLCLGGGARFHDGGQSLLVSGGWQVRFITLWGLYDTSTHDYSAGLGVSEWDWLKQVLPSGLLNALVK